MNIGDPLEEMDVVLEPEKFEVPDVDDIPEPTPEPAEKPEEVEADV